MRRVPKTNIMLSPIQDKYGLGAAARTFWEAATRGRLVPALIKKFWDLDHEQGTEEFLPLKAMVDLP